MPPLYVDLEEQAAQLPPMRPGSFSAAVSKAEDLGKRLPTRLELQYLSDVVRRARMGANEPGEPDRLPDGTKIQGLFSSLWEWTITKTIDPESTPPALGGFPTLPAHLLLGGAAPIATRGDESNLVFPERIGGALEASTALGMRCIRSSHPRLKSNDFPRIVPR